MTFTWLSVSHPLYRAQISRLKDLRYNTYLSLGFSQNDINSLEFRYRLALGGHDHVQEICNLAYVLDSTEFEYIVFLLDAPPLSLSLLERHAVAFSRDPYRDLSYFFDDTPATLLQYFRSKKLNPDCFLSCLATPFYY